jgi:hypothetical protein
MPIAKPMELTDLERHGTARRDGLSPECCAPIRRIVPEQVVMNIVVNGRLIASAWVPWSLTL